MLDIILAAQTIIYLVGITGLIYWMKRNIDALRGAVDAQEKTIKAQAESMIARDKVLGDFESLNKGMKAFFDTFNMRQLVEDEEAYKKRLENMKQAEVDTIQSTFQKTVQDMQTFSAKLVTGLSTLLGRAIPYVPPELRKDLFDSSGLPSPVRKDMAKMEAPDLSKEVDRAARAQDWLTGVFTPEMLNRVMAEAQRRGVTVTDLMTQALKDFLE